MVDQRYVFISYASKDWGRVKPFIDHLFAEGIECWVDKTNIRLTQSFPDELTNAIQSCSVFLLFQTVAAVRSRDVESEVTLAHNKNKKMTRIILDPSTANDFPYQYAASSRKPEINKVSSKAFSDFCSELKNLLHSTPKAIRRGDDTLARLLPYLADRAEQERVIRSYLGQVCGSDNRQVGFYLIHGPLMQCVDSLVERIVHHTLPTNLQKFNLPDTVMEVRVEWPHSSTEISSVGDRLNELSNGVASRLRLPPGSPPDRIAAEMERYDAVAITCELPLIDWHPTDIHLLRDWAEWWSRLPARKAKQPLLILMYLPYGAEWPSTAIRQLLATLAVARDRTKIRKVVAEFNNIRTTYTDHPSILVQSIPPLRSLRSVDAMNWALDHLDSLDRETLRREFDQLFRRPIRLGTRPLPMEPVAIALKDLLLRNRATGEAS